MKIVMSGRNLVFTGLAWTLWAAGPGCNRPERTEPMSDSLISSPLPPKRLQNKELGYSLLYPADWQVRGQVVATEFASGARCESVEIIDSPVLPEPGSTALVLRSFVQICSKRLTDTASLDEFMGESYGGGFRARFHPVEIGGIAAYEMVSGGANTLIFLQTNKHRFQIVAAVVARAGEEAKRAAQVQQTLRSLSFT